MVNVGIIALMALLITSSLAVDTRRRSRIDSPIENAADAPLEDNLATASGSEVVVENVEAAPAAITTAATTMMATKEKKDKNAVVEKKEECNSDNISFELVTG